MSRWGMVFDAIDSDLGNTICQRADSSDEMSTTMEYGVPEWERAMRSLFRQQENPTAFVIAKDTGGRECGKSQTTCGMFYRSRKRPVAETVKAMKLRDARSGLLDQRLGPYFIPLLYSTCTFLLATFPSRSTQVTQRLLVNLSPINVNSWPATRHIH